MLLVYYRTYVPHTFLGFLFEIDDSNVGRGNRRLEPLPAGTFARAGNTPLVFFLLKAKRRWKFDDA